MIESAPQPTPNQVAIQGQQTAEQAGQYPQLQEATGLNGKMAGRVVELANRINDAQDIQARHPDLDSTILEKDMQDAYRRIDMHIAHLAGRNLALKPDETAPKAPTASALEPRYVQPMVINNDGRRVPYGQMTRAVGGTNHPLAGRIVN